MESNNYNSTTTSLKEIVDEKVFFNIPIYQRLYVWKEIQVKKFLEDIMSASQANNDGNKKKEYFIGCVVTVKEGKRYDLIDGQQRFTTLWLICNVLRKSLSNQNDDITKFCCDELDGKREMRINFSIREEITAYLNRLISEEAEREINPPESRLNDICNIESAIGYIQSFCEDKENKLHLSEFAEYLMNKVVIVRTDIPENTDLNKLFELINGRGEQLSQTDILKSKIFKILRKELVDNDSKYTRYGELWNACSDMNGYLERNIYDISEIKTWRELLKDNRGSMHKCFDDAFAKDYVEKQKSLSDDDDEKISLQNVLEGNFNKKEVNTEQSSTGDESKPVKSIVTFPMLLLYTLRIHLAENNKNNGGERADIPFFNEKKLLEIFEPYLKRMDEENNASSFVLMLWKVRYYFDKYIVKWVRPDDSNDEVLQISKLTINNNDPNALRVYREVNLSINRMTQLQSILYFSQPKIYEHWIAPLVYQSFELDDFDDMTKYLHQLDNYLLCNEHNNNDMKSRTWTAMTKGLPAMSLEKCKQYFERVVNRQDGLSFAHYWFYKMDYMLWNVEENNAKWKNYRFTSKNSVEHISPQTPLFGKSRIDLLDSFGNLVLVSREINSSYSNKSYAEKRAQFINKRENNNYIDSLKSDVIYSTYQQWTDSQCEDHLSKMKEVCDIYFQKCFDEYSTICDKNNMIRKWAYKMFEENKLALIRCLCACSKDEEIVNSCLYDKGKILDKKAITYIYDNKNIMSTLIDDIELSEFESIENYYFAKYPKLLSYINNGYYRKCYDGRIILCDGARKGLYNYCDVICRLIELLLPNHDIFYWKGYLVIRHYFDGIRFTDERCQDEIRMLCWFDYQISCMCYEVEVVGDDRHSSKRYRLLKANGWVLNDEKQLYLEKMQYLHTFSPNASFERIAKICAKEIVELFKSIDQYE